MDFFDPRKQRAHAIRVIVSYVLLGLTLVMATTVLLYQAYGFGVDRHGQVVQNGLVFISSQPRPANIFVNGKLKDATNTRLFLPAGQYTIELQRDGYRNWKRAVTIEGGSVEHFDYPFLFPAKMATTSVKKYSATPGLVLQSPDHRWLLVQVAGSMERFEMFDLNAKDVASSAKTITLPDNVLSEGTAHTWELAEWSTDNRHALLRHLFQRNGQPASEYILVDRQDPTQTLNLSATLGTETVRIELRNKKYDQYYLFDQAAATLSTASLKEPQPKPFLSHVLASKSHGSNLVLYASDQNTETGKVALRIRDGSKTYTIRQVAAGSAYLLELAQYSGTWYAAAGAVNENRVYVYKDPMAILSDQPDEPLVPVSILKVASPNYLAFSDNARFIMAENADHFALYDAENDKAYGYQTRLPLDAPQTRANWMDGHRLTYVSGGKIVVFDFDSANQQQLVAANPGFKPLFDQRYKVLYTFTDQPATDNEAAQAVLSSTALLTSKDQ